MEQGADMQQRAIIFDMDGTIVDTNALWDTATAQLMVNRGVRLSAEEQAILSERIHGLATHEACRIIKEMGNLQVPLEELIREKRSIAHSLYGAGNIPLTFIPGFPEFHAQVAAQLIKTGVATNADEDILQKTNLHMGLSKFFGEHLYSMARVNNRCKPHPDIYLHVADKLETDPQYCIAVEDSAHGVAAAKAAGMFCIGIMTSTDRSQVKKADLIVESYQEIKLDELWSPR